MLTRWMTLLTAAVAGLATAGHAMDISQDLSEELAMGWKMGLRPRQNAQNLQFFDGKVGGAGAPGPDFDTAAGRACDNQKNDCARLANSGGGNFQVSDCDKQNNDCKQGISQAAQKSFDQNAGGGGGGGGNNNNNNNGGNNNNNNSPTQPERALVSSDANFDYFCDV
ncbi:uncharacterized protein VDAG_01864 [Verticillium dahliae VdLs.17]|uniref:Uncharacterized protein n=1 Tax=Verticillium dahliae (strain VdLs.17 / ATCC MYA-4575 / FGSC 10137) TaxID=498257 RepID=G2WW78_VERDV|nr:uncharacterized protein VDAG_01864 [Verticillium dahliae VdLs.17]EGY19848.1 hypothetical protein VDAG_01864 [Verticillium dahliae VdLs.17]KAH6706163.1 hypothetical protein EV126DRAFT_398430 [Verticillium dahliae]